MAIVVSVLLKIVLVLGLSGDVGKYLATHTVSVVYREPCTAELGQWLPLYMHAPLTTAMYAG